MISLDFDLYSSCGNFSPLINFNLLCVVIILVSNSVPTGN